MNSVVLKILKAILPPGVRFSLRRTHRALIFRRAMKEFQKNPEAALESDNTLIDNLIYGWGNATWSALDEYLRACVRHALASPGPILECGSGLSTVLVGAIAMKRNQAHWVLEHAPEWAARTAAQLKRYRLNSVELCVHPLKDYGEFHWYDVPLSSMPSVFSLVICDGPPARTPGGRYGLVPIMKRHLAPGCLILLDDAAREAEQVVARRWADELLGSFETIGSAKPYIEMTLPDAIEGVSGARRDQPHR